MSNIGRFLDALEEDREYDFIGQWYNTMSKDELKTILLEYIYGVHCLRERESREEVKNSVRDFLEEKDIFG